MADTTNNNGLGNKILARILSVGGIALVSLWLGILITQNWDAWPAGVRLALGFGLAVGLGGLGEYLRGSRWGWLGTCFLVSGYAMGYFFSYAAHYVDLLQVLPNPVHSWLLMTGLAGLCTLHSRWNRTLAWFAAPGVLAMAGHVLYRGLLQPGNVDIGGWEFHLSTAASIGSVLWCTILTMFYKHQEKALGKPQGDEEEARWWLYRISHELYFVLAAASALAVPFFCDVLDQLPFCWALEGALLLALSWREGAVFKHLVVWAMFVGAGFLGYTQLSAGTATGLSCATLSAVALLCGITYRLRWQTSAMTKELSIAGYCILTYGGLLVGTVSAFWLLGWSALPWIVSMWCAIFLMGVGFRDVLMYRLFYPYSLMTLGFFFCSAGSWSAALVVVMALLLFGLSRVYERIFELNGWMQDENYLLAWPIQTYDAARGGWYWKYEVMAKEESHFMACIAGGLAHLTVFAGVIAVMPGSLMAIGWSIASVVLTAYGLLRGRIPHWVAALIPLGAAVVRLFMHDFSHLTQNDFNIGFAVTGICFLLVAAMHSAHAKLLSGKTSNNG